MDARQRSDLDRHITGNYGEDQFKGTVDSALCDSCYEFFLDETQDTGVGIADRPQQRVTVQQFITELADIMADHNCDHVDEPEIPCACTGHKPSGRKYV